MPSERPGTFVFVQLPSTDDIVVAGRYELDTSYHEHVGYFTYGRSYLARDEAISLDPVHLPLRSGQFRTTLNEGLFGALRDAAPDFWGRVVIERTGSPADELDYLLATSDLRVGALSFGPSPTPPDPDYSAALPLSALDRAADAASAVEAGIAGEPVEFPIDQDLLNPSSGVGGARPKTIVIDDLGQLWIAKFPSRNDRFNNAAAEATCLKLAERCGIEVPEFRILDVGGRSILLIRRFDQRPGPIRRPFLSAHTLLGLGTSATQRTGWSYIDLAHVLRRISIDPEADARALYRRAIFNALISNLDDHPRNHAVLWSGGWRLSPAYDLTPSVDRSQDQRRLAMAIGGDQSADPRWANRATIISSAGHFGSSEVEAERLISEMKEIVVSEWRAVAQDVAPKVEIEDQIEHAFPDGYPGFEYSSLG
jgi:serine/threonine-protein kinase HipA